MMCLTKWAYPSPKSPRTDSGYVKTTGDSHAQTIFTFPAYGSLPCAALILLGPERSFIRANRCAIQRPAARRIVRHLSPRTFDFFENERHRRKNRLAAKCGCRHG